MASVKVRYVPKSGYASKIMNSGEVMAIVDEKGLEVKARADSMGSATYAQDTQAGRNRCHSIVYTPSMHAINSNAKHNSLLKALG